MTGRDRTARLCATRFGVLLAGAHVLVHQVQELLWWRCEVASHGDPDAGLEIDKTGDDEFITADSVDG